MCMGHNRMAIDIRGWPIPYLQTCPMCIGGALTFLNRRLTHVQSYILGFDKYVRARMDAFHKNGSPSISDIWISAGQRHPHGCRGSLHHIHD
ncbi:hypothetical protein GDO81_016761 [Engystomops pustulosus]|uniref:Uncharacterized protein n=1 Tax=Engystomops pustulosus TaxID=76066 RepID=A0AAV7ADA1_ENGPU|nr:hypothetical protein GDO81_016761 [Engystomops pustulosus]